jgi:hypothetical protein
MTDFSNLEAVARVYDVLEKIWENNREPLPLFCLK